MTETQKNIRIAGVGAYTPERIVTNQDFEKTLDTSDEWITQRTGIKERHYAAEDQVTSDLATEASLRALAAAGLEPSDVELIVVATATGDMVFPSTACMTQAKIGAKDAVCFDVVAGCTGFIYALVTAQQYLKSGTVGNALVIGAEILTRFSDMTDRSSCVLFGDGAGAVVLKPCGPERGILETYLGADGTLGPLLDMPAGGSKRPPSHETVDQRLHTITMQGRKVYVHALKAMGDSIVKVIEDSGFTGEDLDILFPHQANIRIIQSVAERAGLPMEKVFVNIQKYGNTSAASIPIAMAEAIEEGRLVDGMLVGLVAFGSGFTWGAALMRW
jgi:3-oxoacyl-[acyl-carrier-protein] synthase-3